MKGRLEFAVRWSGVLCLSCLAWFMLSAAYSNRHSLGTLPIYSFGVFYALWLAKIMAHVWVRASNWKYGWLARAYIVLMSIPGFPITILSVVLWNAFLKKDYESTDLAD